MKGRNVEAGVEQSQEKAKKWFTFRILVGKR